MTQTVRLTGRFMNAPDEVVDIVCDAAVATVPPSRRQVGAGGDVQTSIMPTAVVLYDVEPESIAVLRKGDWTHIRWPASPDDLGRDLQVRQIFIEGANVRVIV